MAQNKQPQKRTEPIVQPNKEITISETDVLNLKINGKQLQLITTAIEKSLTVEYGVPLLNDIQAQVIAQKA